MYSMFLEIKLIQIKTLHASVMMYTFIFEGWHGKPQEAPKFSQEEEPRPGMFEASSMAGG